VAEVVRSAGRTVRAGLGRVLVDAVIVVTGIVVYFGVRGVTAGSPTDAVDHAHDVLRVERALGLDWEDEAQLVLDRVDGLATVANWVYIWGHWPVIAGALVWLALHDRVVFRRLRNALIASGALGLCVYTTYPVAPPRLAGLGLVDTVTESSQAYRVLQPPAFVNQYAAMPSLHVGWDLLVGLALVATASTVALRLVGWAMPVLMALATVVTANHYVLDVLVGAGFGLAGWLIALRLERRGRAVGVPAQRGGERGAGDPGGGDPGGGDPACDAGRRACRPVRAEGCSAG
jgi:membrane-associated phospholipid phosphatase